MRDISCQFKQFGFLCNEVFIMCVELSGNTFMKCFQLENKFPTLLGLARSVVLRTYSLDELMGMNLLRTFQSILHLPIIKVID